MPYQSILKKLVASTPDAIGAIMVDWEGEAVQEYCHCEPYQMRFTAAHQGIILSRFKAMHASQGMVEDLVITTTTERLIIGCIDQEYALAMNVGRSCPMGLALHHFRIAIEELGKEI
ncbi:hypothetical protein [Geobacter sp. SVR]|uniref:hypothetical protein n=1 Tax=Geobacter sp. SVR TaxID=2495594 RepID=UPI00143EF922|nr:hypothetical protein [Geobacter sp. SVR]BCS56046.1 GTPase [Geobacter sp. SVR]GCF84809.1 GTPase [Geobacter sp. SVR]